MAHLAVEILGRVVAEVVFAGVAGAIRASLSERPKQRSPRSSRRTNQFSSESVALPRQQSRAVLTASSNITFGNDCERLVNIAFQTSQSFPTMMGNYGDVIQYLRQELAKQYSGQYFDIIIGRKGDFGFSVDDSQHYAEIEHERYRVIIFATKQNPETKLDTHDANSKISFVWQ